MSAPSPLFARRDPNLAARLQAAAVLAASSNAEAWVECFGEEPFAHGDEARHDSIHVDAIACFLGRDEGSVDALTDDEHAALWPVYLPMLRAEIARLQLSKRGA